MGHKVAKQCESCGNPTRRQQKYCSSVCYTEGRTCKVDIDCDYCGVTFETRQWKVVVCVALSARMNHSALPEKDKP